MAETHKLLKLAVEKGERLETLIPRTLVERGTVLQTAYALGVYPASIYNWLKKNPDAVSKYKAAHTQPTETQTKNEEPPTNG